MKAVIIECKIGRITKELKIEKIGDKLVFEALNTTTEQGVKFQLSETDLKVINELK